MRSAIVAIFSCLEQYSVTKKLKIEKNEEN